MKPEQCEGCRLLRPPVRMISSRGGCYKASICGWKDKPITQVHDCTGKW